MTGDGRSGRAASTWRTISAECASARRRANSRACAASSTSRGVITANSEISGTRNSMPSLNQRGVTRFGWPAAQLNARTLEAAARLADRMIRPSLTPRELDVLRLVSRGRTNKEMAVAMFISEETVKSHMKGLFQKLGVHDRAEAVGIALQRGLLRLE